MARSARSYRAEELRARGWTYKQIAVEWKRRYGFNSRVAFRLAHGLTQADVARLWNERWPDPHCPKSAKQFSYWEIWPDTGGRMPSVDTLNRLACLYYCSAGDLLDGEDHSHLDPAYIGDLAVNRGLPSAARVPPANPAVDITVVEYPLVSPADRGEVEDFAVLTDTYRRMDYQTGSHSVAADVDSHLQRLLALSGRAETTATHRHLMSVVGDAAQLAGWLAIDRQRYDQARGYCQLALSVAQKTGDRPLHAYVLGVISYIYLHAGDGHSALRILNSAQDTAGPDTPAAVRAWIAEARGEAFAFLEDSRSGLRALSEAERSFDRIAPANTPVWLSFFNAECHAVRLRGRCLMRLRRSKKAAAALSEALNLLPGAFVRERAGTLIDLAFTYVQLKEIEEGCRVARQATDLAQRTQSERNLRRLRELLVELMPWTDLGCVRDLYHQLLLN